MAHPKAGGNSGITEILNVEDVASLVAYFVGRSSLRRFRAAWLAGARWAAEALPLLGTRCTGSVYVCGGYSGAVKLRSAERFNPVEGSWEMLPAMLQVRSGPAATSFEGELYVFGTNSSTGCATAERFVPALGRWEAMPSMLQGRERPASAAVGGSLYVCGGVEKETSIFALLRTVERLRLDDGAHWEAQPAMLEPRDSPAAAALGRNLYICGGDGLQFQPLNSVERFNLDENNWEALPPMFERRSGAAAVALLGQIYVCGGSDGVRRLRSVERYNPDTASWHQVPAMLQQRFAPAAAAVAGKLYVCGGADDRGQLDSVECFDPVRECWGEIPSMHFARVRAAAAAVSD